jgi:hypothetical protein
VHEQRSLGRGLGGEVEVLERLAGREGGGADPVPGTGGVAGEDLRLRQRFEEALVGPLLAPRLLGDPLQALADPGRLQLPDQVGQALARRGLRAHAESAA